MAQNDFQRFRDWCLTSGALVGRILEHPTFGPLNIKFASRERVSAEGLDFTANLLGPEAFRTWIAEKDREDLFQRWRCAERGEPEDTGARRRDAKRIERETSKRARRVRDIQDM